MTQANQEKQPDGHKADEPGTEQMDREREIVKGSLIGIGGNVLLMAFKLAVGFASQSIAIILDGVNNATDALSSIITIAGTKLSLRPPDARHPFGYGRIEYLTAVVIAIIILIAGVGSLQESIVKIMHPGTPSYSTVAIVVIAVAILAKIGLGACFKHFGKKTGSQALIASGIDSNYDAVLSAGTLVVALAQNIWGLNIDGLVGLIISIMVCKAGIDVLRDALSPIIGTTKDASKVQAIRQYVLSFPQVHMVYDIILDDFGPQKTIGLLSIGILDTMSAYDASLLSREITRGLMKRFGIIATVGIRLKNSSDAFDGMYADLQAIIQEHPMVLESHGFYVDERHKVCYFDLVMTFKVDSAKVERAVVEAMKEKYPDYAFDVFADSDFEQVCCATPDSEGQAAHEKHVASENGSGAKL